jgi:hypothetical protein
MTDNEKKAQTWMGGDGIEYSYAEPPTHLCTGCRKPFPWDGNEYKKLCLTCYAANVKKCSACKINNIPISAPSWQVACTDCWLKGKAKKYGTCPTCPPERANHLRRRLDKACCEECTIRLVKLAPKATVNQ